MIFLLALFIQSAFAYVPSVGPQPMSQSQAVTIATDQTPIPISGNFTATVDTTGLATSAGQTTGNTTLDSILASILTNAQLRASPVPVSASIDTTGLATDTAQATGNATLDLILGAVSSPLSVTGTFWPATQPVSGTFWQATQPVSGTFWQATQPVSLPSPLPVAGNFYQATQPVSIASMPSTPVTGSFYQATQPVSLASAPTTAVTGTFWQATQPVSGTFWQATQPVSGTFWQSTQPVSLASTVTVSQATTGGNPCLNPASTLVSITGATSTNNATQIIALSGSTKIYICSMTIIGVSGTSPTFSLVQGTGSNCVTNQATVVQAWATTAGTLYAFANPVAVGVAGGELCYKDGGTSPVENYQINYVQQ